MKPGGSIPCSQQSATGPYPEPDAFSPHPPTLFPNIHSNIVFSSTSRSSEWPPPFRCSDHKCEYIYLSHACYIPRLYYPPWFNSHNNIWWSVQVTKLFTVRYSRTSRHVLPLRFKILLSTPFSINLNLRSSLNVKNQVSHQYKTTGKIMVLQILISKVFRVETGRQKILNKMAPSVPQT
jgi:hypothetical protein